MVQRLSGPEHLSACALSREVGVSQGTLSRWLRAASTLPAMGADSSKQGRDSQSPRHWTTEHKLRVLAEASQLSDAELGSFLRREGLHQAQLVEWRRLLEAALESPKAPKRNAPSSDAKKIRALELELRRKEKALAELAALLTLKKKLDAIWGDGDDDTSSKSGR